MMRVTEATARRLGAIASGLWIIGMALPALAVFTTFESGHVRPLVMSPDGTRLFAVDTPDDRLEIFSIGAGGLTHTDTVAVGLEPVAVAARSNSEVWVVNHLSDSISIVDVSAVPPRVTRTLLVGDEPRDIVFAGPGGNRAFITCAHRGQNDPNDPQLTTAGTGRADVWVFDATNLGSSLGGTPLAGTPVVLFGDTPRALAVSPDGNTVYAAVFHSGNRTTSISEGAVCNDGNLSDNIVAGPCTVSGVTMPGGLPNPERNIPDNQPRPETGLIVKFNGTHWTDRICPAGSTCSCQGGVNAGILCTQDSNCPASVCGRNWDNAVKFTLPDKDVFAINAAATPPVQTSFFSSVGTILFNMITNPISGKVYVSNGEARNEVRFEGPGGGGSTVQGHLLEMRISVLSGGTATAHHLNKHIDYSIRPAPAGVKDNSLATPMGMAVTADGATLYVAAFGSSKVGVFDTTALENDTFVPDGTNYIAVSGGGPSGIALDEARHRLYVLTRFDNGIAVVNTDTKSEVQHPSLYNPEPATVINGRRFLYDAFTTSSNGEAACASCHIFGDFDSLAWDLGNPDDAVLNNPNPFRLGPFINGDFHPLKGPMTTQTLRGMNTDGPMHWRGDRTGGNDPGGDPLDENAAFNKFNVAFPGLIGRSAQLTAAEMQAFTDFILQVTLPPNPIRALDNSLTTAQQTGKNFFLSASVSDTVFDCDGCHKLDRTQGSFGTDGFSSFENEPQIMKIAHLRNLYQKVGMFGMPAVPFFNSGDNGFKGDQVRGFGFLHDGSVDTVFRFHHATVFNQSGSNPGGFASGASGDTQRRNVEQFMLAFDTTLFPIVGQQITLTNSNGATANPRIDLLIARAAAGECEVTVKGTVGTEQRGWYRTASGTFQSDRANESSTDAALRSVANTAGQQLTYTSVPLGSAVRIGVDRDEDGFFDRDELDLGFDPADPASAPSHPTATPTQTWTSTKTPTVTQTPTNTQTPTPTPTATQTPTQVASFTDTPTNTPSLTPGGPTLTPTETPTETPTHCPTSTPCPANSFSQCSDPNGCVCTCVAFTPTSTSTITETPTVTATPSVTPTQTPIVFCSNGGAIAKARFRVGMNLDPAGDETFSMSGRVMVPLSPPVSPITNGFRFAVYDTNGLLLYQRVIPGGAAALPGGLGWTIGGHGQTVKFVDRTGLIVDGITSVSVHSSVRTPGLYSFKVRGKLANFQVAPAESPVRLTVVLGDGTQSNAGQCGTLAFNPATGTLPRCKLSTSGNVLGCR